MSYFAFFLSWWGAFVLALLDSTLLFFFPFGIDILLIYLTARSPDRFWLFALLAAAGSVVGVVITYTIGAYVGEKGLPRLIPKRQLARLQARVSKVGAVAVAGAALLPPPFPLTPFVLSSGAFKVSRRLFFSVFAIARLLRFGLETLLVRRFGTALVGWLESATFRSVIIGLAAIAVGGTVASGVALWRRTRQTS